jgi:glutaconate CoA-transferase subunit A
VFYRRWDSIARDRETFQTWLKQHVLNTADFSEFLRVLGEQSKQATAR